MTIENGKEYCPDCHEANFTECESCCNFFPNSEIHKLEESEYCESCYQEIKEKEEEKETKSE